MSCLHCGSTIPDGARFCPQCGSAADVTVASADVHEPAGRGSDRDGTGHDLHTVTHGSGPSTRRPSSSSGWLTSSDSISHGRFPPGTVLDARYRVIGLLGKGGMGEVYRADDLRLGQPVALKFLPDSVGHDPGKLAQFHNEVRTARQVSHPNICRVHDIGDVDGQLFISMEFVDGEDLATSLRRIGRFPEDKATDIARQLCAGLAAAHDRGILHRDLKPANIMLDGAGKVRLMDFGLAAIGVVDDVRAGTPAYMAPEQFLGQEVTARTDIYALGLVLYELYTGRRAFTAATLSELIDQQQIGQVTPPASIVAGLDQSIERSILRCLDPVPARRPVSVLAVSAALPGGDPLAAALAAGETPSPEMVAAAGEGAGLSRRTALSILAAIVLGVAGSYAMALRTSPLAMIRPELTSEVLAQKAREAIRQIGYPGRASDEAYGFEWDGPLIDHFKAQADPPVQWREALSRRPSPLLFWYRRSESPMTAVQFHTDLLTPGIVAPDDPAPVESGMLALKLDHQGFLTFLEAIPPQFDEKADPRPSVDWTPVLTLAGLDPASLTAADPQWNWLAAADTRVAWTGTWPGTSLPLRVEAAALRGRPVAFMTMGPWTRPWRTSSASSGREMALIAILFLLAFAILAGGLLLARKNLREGRGDRSGAAVLGCSLAAVLMLLWACRVHVVASMGLPAMFLIAVCTAVFYGVLFWAIYLAVEPFLRRHWPQTLVSSTTLLGGRVRDRVIGRDVLVGVALGVAIGVLVRGSELLNGQIIWPSVDLLLGTRSTIGEVLTRVFYGARTGLFIVFLLVMLRVLLRSQWMAAVAFVVLLTIVNALGRSDSPVADALLSILYFSMFAATILKWGLTSLSVGLVIGDLLIILPAGTELSAWYAGQTALLIAFPLALAAWAVYTSVGGRRQAASG